MGAGLTGRGRIAILTDRDIDLARYATGAAAVTKKGWMVCFESGMQ
jgi:hypothetical protein